MTNPKLPNFKLDEILAKVEELVSPIVESISEAFDAPEAETGSVGYTDLSTDLIYALQTKIDEVENSQAFTPHEKIDVLLSLYSIWATVI